MFITPRQYYQVYGNQPRKRFGQHFLVQPGTAEQIVRSADLKGSDVVVEVGPGLGALTQFILKRVERLHLVELDRDLADFLRNNIPASECKVTVHQTDVLNFDFEALSRSEGEKLVVLGNLPYNISSPLVFHLLKARQSLDRAVFMLQKEVGERLAAPPGTKDYGVLSVLLGIYAKVQPLFTVGPKQFYPPPKVDSLVISIDFSKEPPVGAPSYGFLKDVVNAAFQQRRKTLHNSLKAMFGRNVEKLNDAFSKSDIDPRRRPETLTPDEFMTLSKLLEDGLSTEQRSSQ